MKSGLDEVSQLWIALVRLIILTCSKNDDNILVIDVSSFNEYRSTVVTHLLGMAPTLSSSSSPFEFLLVLNFVNFN